MRLDWRWGEQARRSGRQTSRHAAAVGPLPAHGEAASIVAALSNLLGMVVSVWRDWREVLVIAQPATVADWHRQGFRLC